MAKEYVEPIEGITSVKRKVVRQLPEPVVVDPGMALHHVLTPVQFSRLVFDHHRDLNDIIGLNMYRVRKEHSDGKKITEAALDRLRDERNRQEHTLFYRRFSL